MNTVLAEIEASTRRLTADEREQLAMKLLESVHNQELNEVDTAWLEVAEARFEDYRTGRDSGIAEEDFFCSVQKELGWK